MDDAKDAGLTALAISDRIRHEFGRATAMVHLAEAYERSGDMPRAVACLSEVVRIDRLHGLPKLAENTRQLAGMKKRLSVEDATLPG